MKKIYCIPIMIFSSLALHSQMKVALHHNGTVSMFSGASPFIAAYDASVNGDTIYLPGGIFNPPPVISKGVYIIGAGHYPDSTTATSVTDISTLNIYAGANKLKLEGLNIPNGINFATNEKIDSVVILRCFLGGLAYNGPFNPASNCDGHLIYQNIIASIHLMHSSNIRVFNNYINSMSSMQENAWIKNNIITVVSSMSYCFFENNIIGYQLAESYNTFRNNIFENPPTAGTNTYLNNYNNHPFSTVFVNYTGWGNYYIDNFHLVSPGTYIGTDATQVGIYGGLYPYKEGAVPSNPHIRAKSIGLTPDVNGKLKVNFTVAAQNN